MWFLPCVLFCVVVCGGERERGRRDGGIQNNTQPLFLARRQSSGSGFACVIVFGVRACVVRVVCVVGVVCVVCVCVCVCMCE